jgi:5-deoxy-D-glucuronate isomerase
LAICAACGANIQHGTLADGSKVPLEIYTEPDGDRRYRVTETQAAPERPQPILLVEAVAEDAPVSAYPDHRKECPAYDAGRTHH